MLHTVVWQESVSNMLSFNFALSHTCRLRFVEMLISFCLLWMPVCVCVCVLKRKHFKYVLSLSVSLFNFNCYFSPSTSYYEFYKAWCPFRLFTPFYGGGLEFRPGILFWLYFSKPILFLNYLIISIVFIPFIINKWILLDFSQSISKVSL